MPEQVWDNTMWPEDKNENWIWATEWQSQQNSVRPAKTQISLGIRPSWSETSLCAEWVAKDPSFLHADSEDWSDWADAQADLSLLWAHTHFVGFVMRQLIYKP